jgi:hypothetical protein
MTTMNLYDMTDTWNAGATTFTAVKMDVTDTASASGSLLLDLQVGGSSRFSVTKAGRVTFLAGASADPSVWIAGNTIYRGATQGATALIFGTATNDVFAVAQNTTAGAVLAGPLNFSTAISATADTVLVRDAADTLAQRRGTNAQELRVYETFTDVSNYRRGYFRVASGTLRIGWEGLGTGGTSGNTVVHSGAGAGSEVYISTSGTLRWKVDGNGHLVAQVDNTYDIGASGASRPRSIYTSQGVSFANSLSVNSSTFHTVVWNGGQYGWAGAASSSTTTAIDTGLARSAAKIVRVTDGSTGGGAMQLTEMTAPAAPAADNVRIYAEDNGSGKTRLMALFATGAAVQIAIEP